MSHSRRKVRYSSDLNCGPPSDQSLTGAPAPQVKKERRASVIRRVDVFVSGKGYTWGQPLNWSATIQKSRPRKVPRSAKINSNGRDAGLCGRRGSDGLEGRRSEQEGQDLTAMTISLSIEGQYTGGVRVGEFLLRPGASGGADVEFPGVKTPEGRHEDRRG
jgi:hypothetical protein